MRAILGKDIEVDTGNIFHHMQSIFLQVIQQ
jgi:hypothetical protein